MPEISIWEQETFLAPQDLILVGSGFCGLWAAVQYAEKNPTKRITILERGSLPYGASTRNAGFSCFGSPSEILHDIQAMGADAVWNLVDMRFRGLARINQYFPDSVTGFDHAGGYECFEANSAVWDGCASKLDELNRGMASITGITHTFQHATHQLNELGLRNYAELIENKLEGGLHSGFLLQALWRKAQALGVQVLTGVTVHALHPRSYGVDFETSLGWLHAKQGLLCTNAFTRALLPQADIEPARGQVFVTSPLPHFRLRGTFHAEEGYYYFRNLGDRLLIGGARHTAFEAEATTEVSTTAFIQEKLESYAQKHVLPENQPYTITHRWSGIMGMGSTKFPIVERVSDQLFVCARMSGMGVALAPVVTERAIKLMEDAEKS